MRYIEKSSVVLEIRTALSGQKQIKTALLQRLKGKRHKNCIVGSFQQQPWHPVTGRAFGDDNSVTKEFGDVTARE